MTTIAVVGLGLIGGSIAAASRAAGHLVIGFDETPGRAARARELGLIDEVFPTLEHCVAGAGIIVIATPISAILSLLPAVDSAAPTGSLILDTGSVKEVVVEAMRELAHASTAVGGHPIAGSELSGPEAANAALLHGRPFVLCPSAGSTADAVHQVETLALEMGSIPLVVSADLHDRVLARTSHLPQIISTALALSLEQGDCELSGPGLRGMVRLASSNPDIWLDIAASNRQNLVSAMRSFAAHFDELAHMIEDGDEEALREAMTRGREALVPPTVEAPV